MKKYLLILFATGICLQACKENSMNVPEPMVQADSLSNENGSWTRLEDFIVEGQVTEYFQSNGYGFAIGEKGYFSGGSLDVNVFREYNIATKQFAVKSRIPVDFATDFVAFSLGSMGYVGAGTGQEGGGNLYGLQNLLQYNPQTDTWSSKADLPETLTDAVGFSIGGRGYIGVGRTDTVRFNEFGQLETYFYPSRSFYEYNPESNCWVKKADFPGVRRVGAVAFTIGKKAYVGTGAAYPRVLPFEQPSYLKDFWEYDPATDRWTRMADFSGNGRYDAVGFSIGNKGYIGTGVSFAEGNSGGKYQKDFWEYEPLSNSWKQIDDFPGGERLKMIHFSAATKGYVIGGQGASGDTADFWEYDPTK